MEHWEEIVPGGFRMLWEDELFRPGTDSFLLSAFPRLRRGMRVCDLGSGTGLLGLLLLQRERELSVTGSSATEISVTGIEIQPRAAELARRCAEANGLGERLRTLTMDYRDAPRQLPPGGFHLVISNPPYYAPGTGKSPASEPMRTARSEAAGTLKELITTAAYLLRYGGSLCLIQKPERLADLICFMRLADCEIKRLRFVLPRSDAAPSLVLAEGRRGGKPGLRIETPLILQREDGSPTEECSRIYFRVPPTNA